MGIGDVRNVIIGVALISLVMESAVTLILTTRFMLAYGEPFPRAVYLGVFHAVSAFNNAGFALYPDNMMGFVTDPWICLPVALAVIIGGLGFPVILEVRRHLRRPGRWSVHTKITVSVTGILLLLSTAFVTATEWSNPRTLGPLAEPSRLLAGFFQAVALRTAGFNSIDIAQMKESTWLGMDVFMFIGGGSAGTAGGIKVTTFALLFFVIWSEVRGESATTVFERRMDGRAQRQALTVALLSVAAVVSATIILAELTDLSTDQVLFESVSAFATVGLTTGITPLLSTPGHLLLVGLMFVGRLGPVTLVSALALRESRRRYEHPEGRPIVG